MMPKAGKLVLWIALCSVTLGGCVSAVKPPTMLKPGFESRAIDRLVLLPVADHRVDKSSALDLDAWVFPIAEKQLTDKRYAYVVDRDRAMVDRLTPEALESPSQEWLRTFGPSGSRWVMVLVLEDSSSGLTFGSTGNADMSGYLFDKEQGSLVWRNKEHSRIGQGGLIGMAVKGLMERGAIEAAAIEMFRALPFHHQKD